MLTKAGSAAGLDLCLYIARKDHGGKIVNYVARRLVLPAHRKGGQAQFILSPVSNKADGLASFLDWLKAHIDEHHTIASLAAKAGLSEHTFVRRFQDSTGTSPHVWLT